MSHFFLTDDFLLQSNTAKRLYHDYVKTLPIIDYHCHLPPDEIASNKQFANLTEIWLKGDHYKWRAQRSLGVSEHFITGTATDEEKFHAWAKVVPQTVRNPLFHWTHMELKTVFNLTEYLNEHTAAGIYQSANELLKTEAFTTRGLLSKFKVEYVGTTDEPWDSLEHHQQLANESYDIKVLPSFRPDKILFIDKTADFFHYLLALETASGIKVTDIASLLSAIENRVDYFHANGCRVSDHGFMQMPASLNFSLALEIEFKNFLQNKTQPFSDPVSFMGFVLLALSRMYHQRDWVQQFHLGPIRDNNTRLNQKLGANAGFDSIGDFPQALAMSLFFDRLDQSNQLAKTVIYNINPSENEVFASMLGNFNDGSIKGKMQFGSGWWFLDQKDGMEKQINALSNMGMLSHFVGMLTDSRSFLSFPRHEYFRRILCNLLGADVENGELPADIAWLGKLVEDISYTNAAGFFNFEN